MAEPENRKRDGLLCFTNIHNVFPGGAQVQLFLHFLQSLNSLFLPRFPEPIILVSAIYRRNGWTCSVIDSKMQIE